MHSAALDWVHSSFHQWRQDRKDLDVLDVGSLNINGTARSIIEPFSRSYYGIDMQEGPGVDKVADATEFVLADSFDVIVCCEVFEHCENWKKIVDNSVKNLRVDGIFIATMAGEGRHPHSAIDENPIRDWEYYHNVGHWELNRYLKSVGFGRLEVNTLGTDLRCWAIKTAE